MNLKKIVFALTFSIWFSNAVYGMELVKDIVKNEVVPAATIMATGAALSVASDYLFCAADRWYRQDTQFASPKVNIKKSLCEGAVLSLPILALARFGFSTPYPYVNNVSKVALMGGSMFAVLSALWISNDKAVDARIMSYPAQVVTEEARIFTESDYSTRRKLRLIKAVSMLSLGLGYDLDQGGWWSK
jgi:hypothetical protein